MLKSLTTLDSLYRQNRLLTFACIIVTGAVSIYSVTHVTSALQAQSQTVYALVGETAVPMRAMEIADNRRVEAVNHVDRFHTAFYDLDPDPETVKRQLTRAQALGDGSVRELSELYAEEGYYRNLVAANASQDIAIDSITVDMVSYPYRFKCSATLTITRATSITKRSLVSTGAFRDVQRSKANPHGFLIEDYRILANEDLSTERRRDTQR